MNTTKLICLVILIIKICLANNVVMPQTEEWEKQLKQDPENKNILLNLGRYYHDIGGNQDDKEAVNKAEEHLLQLIHIDSSQGLALVYYGSVLTMKARYAFSPWNKLKYVKKGIYWMDKAVFLEPDNPEVRLIRGINFISLPAMFNCFSVGLEDFKYIDQLLRIQSLNLTESFWLPYYYNFGLALLKKGEYAKARGKLLKTVAVNPDSDYAAYARRDLKKIEGNTYEE